MAALPYSAFKRPPWLPGGGVICVNRCQDMPAIPCEIKVHRMAPRHASPASVASKESARKMPFFTLRKARRLMKRAASYRGQGPALEPAKHRLRGRDHRERDEKQQQPQRNQRGGIKIAHGFGEFIGDRGRDGGAGRQQRR